ncbi:MAG: hypothetical protein ABI577_10205, partial [bacterium]
MTEVGGAEPWRSTLRRWTKVVAIVDVVIFALTTAIVGMRGSWSASAWGETLWWVTFIGGLGMTLLIVSRTGVLELGDVARSGIVLPGQLGRFGEPRRRRETADVQRRAGRGAGRRPINCCERVADYVRSPTEGAPTSRISPFLT